MNLVLHTFKTIRIEPVSVEKPSRNVDNYGNKVGYSHDLLVFHTIYPQRVFNVKPGLSA